MSEPEDADTDVLDAFDRRLDPLVPAGPAPVADLLHRGRARRVRRLGLRAGLAAAVAVVAVASGVVVVRGGTGPAPAEPPPSTSRLVGFGGVVVEVPAGWVEAPACGDLRGVAVGPAGGPCSVRFGPLDARRAAAGQVEELNGLRVSRVDSDCSESGGFCVYDEATTVSVLDLGVEVTVTGPEGSLATREAVVDTIRSMPQGSVAVPPVSTLSSLAAVRTITDVGLVPVGPPAGATILTTRPAAGRVVPVGSEVTLDGAPGTTVAYGGLVFDVPRSWTERGSECLTATPGEPPPVVLQDTAATDGSTACGRRTIVAAIDLDTAMGRSAVKLATRTQSRNGVDLRVGSSCAPLAACVFGKGRYVVVPDAGVALLVNGPSEAREVLDSIIASVRLLPSSGTGPGPGVRLVGLGTVAVAVPDDWLLTDCRGLFRDGLAFAAPDDLDRCAGPVLRLRPSPDDRAATSSLNGLGVVVDDDGACEDTASFCAFPATTSVVVPSRGVEVLVAGPLGSREQRRLIADTVQAVPSGSAVVPDLGLPAPRRRVCEALHEVGLTVAPRDETCDVLTDADVVVTDTEPSAGSVVDGGSAVLLTVRVR